MVGCPPSQRLRCQRGIAGSAGSHDGGAEDTQVGNLVRKAPSVHHIRFGIVAHLGTTVGMGGKCRYAWIWGIHGDGARLSKPLLHFLMRVTDSADFVRF